MCVVSMVMDHYWDKWKERPYYQPIPWTYPTAPTTIPAADPIAPVRALPAPISETEIEEFRRLLDRAREYDKQHNEPDCALEEKRALLQQLADKLRINLNFV